MTESSAEQARSQERRRRADDMQREWQEADRRRRRDARLKQAGVIGLLVLAIALAVVWVVRETTMPLPGFAVPDEGRGHVDVGERVQYASRPPSSGSHYPSLAPWGFSINPIAPEYYVHNLEHGGIALLYQCPVDCPELRRQVQALHTTLPRSKYQSVKLVSSPDNTIPGVIVLVAWDRRENLEKFDEGRIRRFYEAFVDRGPEDAP